MIEEEGETIQRNLYKHSILIILILLAMSFTACGGSYYTSDEPIREANDVSLHVPKATGENTYNSSYMEMDYSNAEEGYVMIKYVGSHSGAVKLQVSTPTGEKYTYDAGTTEGLNAFPLTEGNGNYTFTMLEQVNGNQYSIVDSRSVYTNLSSEFKPFLYANQYVNFGTEGEAIEKAKEFYIHTGTDLEFANAVYSYVLDTLSYDNEKAEAAANGGVVSDFLPNIEEIVSAGKGICFDYAALMTAMLRSQNIPTKMQIGYAGEVYHAWISIYTQETGWIDDAIQFDGTNWSIVDPTFGDTTSEDEFKEYVGDGENYVEKYVY